ncbi:unnamed protein product, partial [Ectocarpus sp. 8 AP-2014]
WRLKSPKHWPGSCVCALHMSSRASPSTQCIHDDGRCVHSLSLSRLALSSAFQVGGRDDPGLKLCLPPVDPGQCRTQGGPLSSARDRARAPSPPILHPPRLPSSYPSH